nr:hypothetical protein [Tanacetum cinerariifolium]
MFHTFYKLLQVMFQPYFFHVLIRQCNLLQQWDLFTSAGEPFFTNSGKVFYQWERITGSGKALSILFPTKVTVHQKDTYTIELHWSDRLDAFIAYIHTYILILTYTSVYTDSEPWRYYKEDSTETGPQRVIIYGYDGLPIQLVAPPSLNYVSGPEHLPSPDYVPGPEHLPSPTKIPYVPEPEYSKYLAPSDDEAPLEDQPLPADASPISASLDYVADSDLEEDPKDDQTDYPADGGDSNDEPFDDDDDDDTDDEDP